MKICIIGGGTAGWWCAGYMEKFLPDADITLIESDEIPTIGVGEGTLPQIGVFFEELGIPEKEWMNGCNAVHKYGNIKYEWDALGADPYLMTFWQNEPKTLFDNWYKEFKQGKKVRDDINPDLYDKEGWRAVAYHLDANLAGHVVRDHCKRVNHVIDTLEELPPGYDLYVDATGFRRQFVKDKTEETFSEHHKVNRSWVRPLELEDEITPYTRTMARPDGWQFMVDLQHRTGTGYVFSTDFVSEEEALEKFKGWTAHRTPFKGIEPRLLKWKPGVLKNPWVDNVVSIGLGQGFVDPLEANGLFLVQYSITLLVRCILKGSSPKAYNKAIMKVQKDNSDYILHHYMLSNRTDTEFWKYYSKFNASKTLWESYTKNSNKYTSLYPDAIWASLGLYFNDFKHYPE
jgi:tryptophan halogenase